MVSVEEEGYQAVKCLEESISHIREALKVDKRFGDILDHACDLFQEIQIQRSLMRAGNRPFVLPTK